jgi:hypothetical protein
MTTGLSYSGDEATRTPNPRLAKAVLYQLSYVPGDQREASEVASRHSVAASVWACRRLTATATAATAAARRIRGFFTPTSSRRPTRYARDAFRAALVCGPGRT